MRNEKETREILELAEKIYVLTFNRQITVPFNNLFAYSYAAAEEFYVQKELKIKISQDDDGEKQCSQKK